MKLTVVRISYTSNDAACPTSLTLYHTLDNQNNVFVNYKSLSYPLSHLCLLVRSNP